MTRTLRLVFLAFLLSFIGVTLAVSQGQFLFKAWLHAGL